MKPSPFAATAALAACLLLAAPALSQDDDRPQTRPLPATSTVQSRAAALQVDVIARGLVHPWAVVQMPDGRMLVTERNDGRLRIVDRAGRVSDPVAGVPEIFRYKGETGRSQAGLFDVKLHPGFAQNRLVYLSLSKPTERGASLAIVRGRLTEAQGAARLEGVQTIFELQEDDQDSSGLHFGGRMAIDAAQGLLYLSVGDRRNISRSQEGDDQAGSILRMTLDGAVAPGNPFVGDEEKNDFIFAMGSRNSQALALAPGGALWSIEHGPKGGDRVDQVRAGANLGWPYITGGRDYSGAPMGVGLTHEGMVSPLHVFAETVAPSGALVYGGAMFPGWRGNLLVGGLYNQSLMRLGIANGRVTGVERIEIGRRIRDVAPAADGSLLLVTEHEDGELIRLSARR
jgi:aldose sugar dehydrogenase